jgi:hypothetical protein
MLLGLATCVVSIVVAAPSASACSQQARVDNLIGFFDGWKRGDLSAMTLDRKDATAPFGTTLPGRRLSWSREQQGPRTWKLASVRAWLRRRVKAGDRVTLLRVNLFGIHKGLSGGTLSFRRTAPDIRGGHKLYGVAKFEVRCGGLTAFGNGASWWRWTTAISVCHPGKRISGVRFCGRLPTN